MRVPDKNLAEIWDNGYTILENFIDKESLAAAREIYGVAVDAGGTVDVAATERLRLAEAAD